jgi:hypothetical protein
MMARCSAEVTRPEIRTGFFVGHTFSLVLVVWCSVPVWRGGVAKLLDMDWGCKGCGESQIVQRYFEKRLKINLGTFELMCLQDSSLSSQSFVLIAIAPGLGGVVNLCWPTTPVRPSAADQFGHSRASLASPCLSPTQNSARSGEAFGKVCPRRDD